MKKKRTVVCVVKEERRNKIKKNMQNCVGKMQKKDFLVNASISISALADGTVSVESDEIFYISGKNSLITIKLYHG